MKFRSAYSIQVRKCSPNGSKFKKSFSRHIDADGRRTLISAPPENIYEKIQCASCGISPEELTRRYSMGDNSAIMPDIGSYADLRNVPTNLEDCLKHVARVKQLYSSLPKNVKAHYNNNVKDLVSAINSGEFFKTFNSPSTKEVVSNVSKNGSSSTFTVDQLSQIKKYLKEDTK